MSQTVFITFTIRYLNRWLGIKELNIYYIELSKPKIMGTRNMFASNFVLFLAIYLSLLWPTCAENGTNKTSGNNTLFSRRKNLTKIEYVSCEWSDIRPTYSAIAAVISGFLILAGAVLCAIGKLRKNFITSL